MRSYSDHELNGLLDGKNVLIVSCEAGGAEILSSLLKRIKNRSTFTYLLTGPARDIFRSKLTDIVDCDFSSGLFVNTDLVLTGTSLVPEWERNAIKLARSNKIPVISIIDHWVNYQQRFLSVQGFGKDPGLEINLPDEIWVADNYAYKVARQEGLPEDKLRVITNYYLEDLKAKMTGKVSETGRTLLYVCEPVFDDLQLLYGNGNVWGYNEFDLVGDLFAHLHELEEGFDKLVLRLHPNEAVDKYDELRKNYTGKMPVEISHFRKKRIEDECAQASVILGVESMGLVIGVLLNKPTFSCMPKTAKKKCALPHKEIGHIHSVSDLRNNPALIEGKIV